MAEKKKTKKRKEEYVGPGEEVEDKPTKEEYNIGKWMRKNVPIKKTKFLNHNVEYFTASKAVDALLESKWAQGDEALFHAREDVVDYLHLMLVHKFFHRARKVPVPEQELRAKKKEKKSGEAIEEKKEEKEKEKEKGTDAESSVTEMKKDDASTKEKRKRKVRLDMHNDQRFVDGLDAYVWLYDPIPWHYWIFGTLMVIGAIGVCLFPLWPPSVRLGVYYLSVVAAGFLVFIIFLAVLRLVVFCLTWLITFGKHHLWIFPNLTEDVGFFASFWPLYKYEYRGDGSKSVAKKKKKKDKDSDAEEEPEEKPDSKQAGRGSDTDNGNGQKSVDFREKQGSQTEDVLPASESESESSQRSSTGKDFEMVSQEDFDS